MTVRLLSTALTLAVSAAIFAMVMVFAGKDVTAIAKTLATGGSTSAYGLTETAVKAIPILFCAIAVAIPGRVGLVNIGGEGQLVLGAIGAMFAVLCLPDLGALSFGVMVVTAAIAGGLWGLLPGMLRAFTGANETLLSLLLNYVAQLLLLCLIHGAWKDPASLGWPQSSALPDQFLLHGIAGTRIHGFAWLALLLCAILAFFGRKTAVGMSARVLAANPATARYLGIRVANYFALAFCMAGAAAALGGLGEVAGVQGRLRDGISLGYGYAGFFVAWLCGNRFLLLPFGAFLFALVVTGADSLQVDKGMPFSTVYLLQGLVFLALLAVPALEDRLKSWTLKRP